jgi:nucleotide-binding universal stress UspA family protein
MRRLLVPVREGQAVNSVERQLAQEVSPDSLHVVVLSVQPNPVEWQTRGLFREAIASHLIERGRRSCHRLVERLTATGISCHARVELGDDRAAILRCAAEEGCSEILIQADRLGWARRFLLRATGCVAGSRASQIIHTSAVPVTVVP